MTCRDCIHYEVCKEQDAMLGENKIDELVGVENHCEYFKPKSRFIELPCEVGQTVWVIERGIPEEKYIFFVPMFITSYGERQFDLSFNADAIGKTVFLSREEAEKALAERSK